MNNIGIMQGRLLPRYLNRYQAFPVNYWHAEFHIAQELGFSKIEFILDYNDAEMNPLLTSEGLKEIQNISQKTGVLIKSICADYFMEAPFHSKHRKKSELILTELIKNASIIGAKDIVIPCVDQSSLKDQNDINMFVDSLSALLPTAERNDVLINLETDLDPARFKELLNRFESDSIRVNYDTGNSASLGYKPEEEFEAYGSYISDLHIKDRVLGGASVPLGSGDADFHKVFKSLKHYNFSGNIILQASRQEDYLEDLRGVVDQMNFAKKLVSSYLENE
jgi:L-ribulose-5-phosphate 3-epimerase